MRRIGLILFLQLAIVSAAHAQANTISTYAGGGANTGAATNAYLPRPILSIRDSAGNTYISVPALGIIYKVTTGGTISIFAGTGVLGFSGDGGAATSAQLDYPQGMAFDSQGDLYIADSENNRVRKVTPGGIISTVAGTGTEYNGAGFYGGYSGDGGEATDAFLNVPADVAFDAAGNFYIADSLNNVVRLVNLGTGVISTYAGNGTAGYLGDNGAATSAELNDPVSVTLDASGNLYISDLFNCIVRKVDTSASHIITTFAGTPQVCGYAGDGGAATSAQLRKANAVRMDSAGNLLIADTRNNRIRKVDNTSSHDISTIVGTGVACTTPSGCGDGGAAASALLNNPIGISADSLGNLLVADSGDARVRVVSSGSSPTISAFAGGGLGGDGGAASSAMLALPYIVETDTSGNVFIVDTFAMKVRRVDHTTHTITTVAGNGVRGVTGTTNGDGGAATNASFIHPIGLAIDSTGDLFVLDNQDEVIRKINTQGIISTVAGNGTACGTAGNPNQLPGCGDGGLATNASFVNPLGIAVDSNGTVYVADANLNTIRSFTVGGNISTIAGTPGQSCTSSAYTTNQCGDNGPPTSALLNSPNDVVAVPSIEFTGSTDIYIADSGDNAIRQISGELGTISTVAFNHEPTFGGDTGSALGASMNAPTEVALDAHQNLFVGGGFDNIVRRIDNSGFSSGLTSFGSVTTVAGDVDNLDGGYNGDGEASTKALLSNFGLTVDANENLYIADAGNNRIRLVPMAPVASWLPTTLTAFPTMLGGQISDSQDITFSNTGLNDLTVSVTSISADFSVSNFCTFEVASPQGSCDLFVSFTPPVGAPAGPVSGSLVLATNDPNNPTVTFPLSGTIATTGFTLTVNVIVPAGNVAAVTSDPTGISACGQTGGTCSASFASGTVVTLIAGVNGSTPGYQFLGWSGNCTPVTNVPFECTTTMSQAQLVTATYGASTLTVMGFGNGTGTITSVPAGINCGATCTFTFPAGTQTVTLTATPNTGSVFVGWEDFYCTNSTGNTCTITLSNYYFNEAATAVFSVARVPFTKGDVFLGSTGGLIFEYHPSGTLVQVLPPLNSNYFGGFVYGMTFDNNGTLYAADPFYNFQAPTAGVETFKFDGTGPTAFGGLTTASAGSVRVDPSGNVFVGLEVNSTTGNLLEFAPGNTTAPSAFYFPAYYQTNGIFAFDIAQDDVTMLYDLGTNSLFSYNTALGLQNPDLTDSLPGTYSGDIRQLPDGTILLADGDRVVRLNSTTGAVIQTYQPTTFSFVLGLTLDGDGVDFWTDDSITGVVYKINIATGAIVTQFNTQLGQSTFGGLVGLGGIAEYGSPASGGEDLSVALAGTGTGSVSSNVAGITCPTACTANYAVGQQVTLTATPAGGSTFAGWSGNCSGTGTCTVTMNAAQAVTATFTTNVNFQFTYIAAGTGTGTVTSSPAGIDCTQTCLVDFPSGTVVTLTEVPASGSVFAGWSGACSGTGSCVVTMSSAESVTATFNISTFALNVSTAGTGTGTVTSSPSGISCQPTCSANFNSGTTVTLTATPAAGSTFAGWSGACGGTGTCQLTMTSAFSVTATFNTTTNVNLSVALNGTAYGTVSGGAISCSDTSGTVTGTCTTSVPSGTQVSLFAQPGSGSVFGGWSGGGCSGTVTTCVVTVSAATTVTGTFNNGPGTFPVTIAPSVPSGGFGTGTGTVTSSPAGINCSMSNGVVTGGTCTSNFNSGSFVTLTAAPAAGTVFSFWGGGICGGNTTTTCVVLASAAQSGTATFTAASTFALTVTDLGTGAGTVTSNPAGISCTNGSTTGCTANYVGGTAVTLTATAGANSVFAGWFGQGCTGTGVCTVTVNAAETIQATFNPTTVLTVTEAGTGTGTVSSNPAGILCPSTCSAPFTAGATVTLTGTANSGSTFAGWSGAGCSGVGVCTVNMATAQSVTATFTLPTSALTVTDAGTGSGTVSSTPSGILCPSTCSANFTTGSTVTLTETPNSGSTFAGWSGAGCSGTGTCVVTMSAAEAVTATFNTTTFALTVTDVGTGTGTVTSSPAGITCPSTCSANFNSGSTVTLTETPNSGSTFAGWSGACSGTGSCVVTMSAAESVTATFNTTTFALTVTDAGTGSGSVTSNPSGITCPSTCTANYASGTSVTLTAAAGSGSTFAGWSGACSGTGTCAVTMSAAKSVTATFNTTTNFALTVTDAGTGSGTVSSSPSGILCPSTCSANFASGTQVTLTETPNSGSTFAGWSGACSGTGSCVVTMSAAESVTATFNTSGFALTVTDAGTGSGTVSSSPSGILCPSTCSANFASGTQVTLTASQNAGSTFAGWSGAGCSGTGQCVVTMNAAQSVTATFNITNPTLTIMLNGTGTGSVTFTASQAFTCSDTTGVVTGTCSANYSNGTVVNVSEIPGSGSTFAGWSGGGCSGTGATCNVTLTANTTVTATFNKPTFAVTVSASGAGSGTVTSSPAGISCPSTCTANFTSATNVTLTPVAAAGSTFAGWTDSTCVESGTGPCIFAVTAAVTVQPVFNKVNYTLTVTLAGTGAGTVTSEPQGINCGSGCSGSFTGGTTVTLFASPATGSVFAGWSGACSGTGNCLVTMNAAESVTATFNLPPPSFTLTVSDSDSGTGTGTVTSNPAGIICPDACSASYLSGTVVTLTAAPATGSAFAGWSGAGCSGTGTCVVTMTAAESVVATFNTSTFTFGVGPGYSTSVNTTPGGNIVVGFTLSSTTPETVGLGCTSSAPQYLTCLITPSEVSLTGNGTSQVAIVLTSYCQGSTPGMPEGPTPGIPGGMVGVMLLAMALCGAAWTYRGRRRVALSFAILLFAVVGGSSCGNLPKGTAGATPPGLYTLSITATVAGQAPQLIQLQVNVQ